MWELVGRQCDSHTSLLACLLAGAARLRTAAGSCWRCRGCCRRPSLLLSPLATLPPGAPNCPQLQSGKERVVTLKQGAALTIVFVQPFSAAAGVHAPRCVGWARWLVFRCVADSCVRCPLMVSHPRTCRPTASPQAGSVGSVPSHARLPDQRPAGQYIPIPGESCTHAKLDLVSPPAPSTNQRMSLYRCTSIPSR